MSQSTRANGSPNTPDDAALPKGIVYALAIGVVLSWLPLVLIARAWVTHSDSPRIHLFQGMDNQVKAKPQQANPLFADHRAMRPVVPGTVARGKLNEDAHLVRGRIDGQWATTFPMPITESVVRHGQKRFNVFCSPCHGLTGAGNGPIHKRALDRQESKWVPPTDLTGTSVRDRAVGHIYNSITHGIRNMASYGAQIPVADRWAIVAYIRALQLSQDAPLEAVPAEKREALEATK